MVTDGVTRAVPSYFLFVFLRVFSMVDLVWFPAYIEIATRPGLEAQHTPKGNLVRWAPRFKSIPDMSVRKLRAVNLACPTI